MSVVARVIRSWDPYGLLAGGAPSDEFDAEIAAVTAQIHRIAGPADAAHVVSRVFSNAFDADTFAVGRCRDVGERLFAALIESNLIESSDELES